MAALREPLGPAMYDDARLFDPVVRAMLQRVELKHDVEADAAFFNQQRQPYSVRIDLKDGRSVSRDVEFPRDQPRLGWPELEQKFRTLVGTASI
jgi:2-methylcitrate dehydratase PrpD